MIEDQSTEFKETWRDEYLRTICAFANTDGGILYLGIDDKGKSVGLKNIDKLLEDLPNKIINSLGIVPEIMIENPDGKQILSVVIRKSLHPVSYHGVFYTRSGSTTQELKGYPLQQFILKANNITWDAVSIPDARFEELDDRLIRYFIGKAIEKNRLSIDAGFSEPYDVLKKLDLITGDNQLTRAAVLLFAKRPVKYIRGVAFKVGKFGKDASDLISHDIVECPLFEMPDRVLELLKTKYLHSIVSYKGIERIETLEYPEKAIREAILNAIIHRDYAFQGTEITLHIYDDRLVFWNIGSLLAPLNIEILKAEHPSVRRNILVADVFYRAGSIEAWGRGIKLIFSELQNNNFPVPAIREHAGGLEITVFKTEPIKDRVPNRFPDKVPDKVPDNQKRILQLIAENKFISMSELSVKIGISKRKVLDNITKLKKTGLLLRVGNNKTGHWEILDTNYSN